MHKLADISSFESLQNQAHSNMVSNVAVFNVVDSQVAWQAVNLLLDYLGQVDPDFGVNRFESDDLPFPTYAYSQVMAEFVGQALADDLKSMSPKGIFSYCMVDFGPQGLADTVKHAMSEAVKNTQLTPNMRNMLSKALNIPTDDKKLISIAMDYCIQSM